MSECEHKTITLLESQDKQRVRCRHCHLTITEEELGDGYCPECYDGRGIRHRDFEPVAAPGPRPVRYQCDTCGALIE